MKKRKTRHFDFYWHSWIMSVSEFYYACRNGDVAKVKTLLSSMSTIEIDHVEPNGSTGLHAAAYFGHIDIVRLLLDKGALRSQKNKHNKTPEEEAKTPEIAHLFYDIKVQPAINWTISDMFTATSQHRRFYSFSQGPPTLSYVVDKLLDAKELWDFQSEKSEMDQIKRYFYQAIEKNNAKYLIRAYTLESPFYSILNRTLASHNELTNEERENPPWFCALARLLASDEPSIRPYRWTGTTYRGFSISRCYLAQWQVGKILMNKGFISTTRSLDFARKFAERTKGEDKRGTIFRYIVNDDRAAFDIRGMSEYPHEEEVLILPCMDFEITEINDSNELVEITLLLR